MTQPAEPGFATPPLVVDAAPINYSAAGGLYSATTPINLNEPARISAGVQVRETNTSYTVASWDSRCGAENPDKAGAGVTTTEPFPARVVVTGAECSLVGSDDGELARAEYAMRLAEEQQAEEALAEILAGAVSDPLEAPTGDDPIVTVVGNLEELIRAQRLPVVLHATVRFAALAASKGLVVKGNQAGRLQTPLGSTWVFGSGYGDLGTTLYATGPVTVRRGPVSSFDVDAVRQNERFAIAEREVVTSYEGVAVAQAV